MCELLIDHIKIGPVAFDPLGNPQQPFLSMGCSRADGDTGDDGVLVAILQPGFGTGNIKLLVKPGQQWAQPAAFLFQTLNPR